MRAWGRTSGALLLVAVTATGCRGGSDDDRSADTTPSTTTIAAPIGTAGCGEAVSSLGDDRVLERTMQSSGGARDYLIYVPVSYDQDVPAPIAYEFHGAGSNKEQQLVYGDFRAEADEDGALLVLPDALGTPARWSPLGGGVAGVEGVEDLVFFDDLTGAVEDELCVDPDRVLVTGMSSGGFMAGAVACGRSDRVSAAGPVTATVPAGALCPGAVPVAYSYFHGTDDPIVPFHGGANSPGAVEDTSQAWADQNGCAGQPTDERIGTDVVHRSWPACDAPTDLYIVEGGGHTWPGSVSIDAYGHTTQDLDASAVIWEMFRATWPDP